MTNMSHIIKEFRVDIEKRYGKRLKNIIIYGSWAIDEATEDSDIDVVVVLEGTISPGKEIDWIIDAVTEINLKHKVLISVYPVSEVDYLTFKKPVTHERSEGRSTCMNEIASLIRDENFMEKVVQYLKKRE